MKIKTIAKCITVEYTGEPFSSNKYWHIRRTEWTEESGAALSTQIKYLLEPSKDSEIKMLDDYSVKQLRIAYPGLKWDAAIIQTFGSSSFGNLYLVENLVKREPGKWYVEVGKGSSAYRPQYTLDTERQAYWYYNALNTHSGYKKRLVNPDGKIVERYIS